MLASVFSKSHIKFLTLSHRNFEVLLSEWKVNLAKSDALPVCPVRLMERQESWDGSVQVMASTGLLHMFAPLTLLKLGAHS